MVKRSRPVFILPTGEKKSAVSDSNKKNSKNSKNKKSKY